MEIRVHGNNTQVNGDIRRLIEEKVNHAVRFFETKVDSVDVELAEESNPRIADDRYLVEITAPVAGHIVRVRTASHDQHAAVDASVDRFERQLRRLKERLISRSRVGNKHLNQSPVPAEEDEETPTEASIVRTKQFAMKPMSPEEAALQMDMLGHGFFLFVNSETDSHAVLYRRRDGALGLIDTV